MAGANIQDAWPIVDVSGLCARRTFSSEDLHRVSVPKHRNIRMGSRDQGRAVAQVYMGT